MRTRVRLLFRALWSGDSIDVDPEAVARVLAIPGVQPIANWTWRVVRTVWAWRSPLRLFASGVTAFLRRSLA